MSSKLKKPLRKKKKKKEKNKLITLMLHFQQWMSTPE